MFFYPNEAEARAAEAPGFWDELRATVLAGLDIAEAELADRSPEPFVPARREPTAAERAETGPNGRRPSLSPGFQYWRSAGNQRSLAYVEQRYDSITGDFMPADVRATHRFWKLELLRDIDARFAWNQEANAYVVETAFLDGDQALYRAFERRRETRPYR